MSSIAERIDRVRTQIDAAITRRGPGPDVSLIAVSKRHSEQAITAAYEAGLRDFGENYAQEFTRKAETLSYDDLRWHFIGALQSNKAKLVVGRALVHTVDRLRLVHALQSRAASQGLVSPVLIEVNFGEAQKAGVSTTHASELLDAINRASNLRCDGLMTIPPVGSPEQTRQHFVALRRLRDELSAQQTSSTLVHLSMGMSADFEIAIEEGATMVRVGTAIFGARPNTPSNPVA